MSVLEDLQNEKNKKSQEDILKGRVAKKDYEEIGADLKPEFTQKILENSQKRSKYKDSTEKLRIKLRKELIKRQTNPKVELFLLNELEEIKKRNKASEEQAGRFSNKQEDGGIQEHEIKKLEKMAEASKKLLNNAPENKKKHALIKKPVAEKEPENKTKELKSTLEEIAKILKTEKISQVVVHAKEKEEPKEGESLTFDSDLDIQAASFLLNDFNKRKTEDMYSEGAVSSIIPKGGSKQNLERKTNLPFGIKSIDKKEVGGWKVFLDVSGEGFKIDKENKIIYIDHHEPKKGVHTSAAEIVYQTMNKAGLLKEKPEWLTKVINLVNSVDNLTYLKNIPKEGDLNYFKKQWPGTLNALAEKIPFKNLKLLFESEGKFVNPSIGKQLNDPSFPFTKAQIEGEFGKIEVELFSKDGNGKKTKIKKTIADIVAENFSWKGEAQNTIKGIKKVNEQTKNRGLTLDNTNLGDIIYQKIIKTENKEENKKENIFIPRSTAFIGTKYSGKDTFVNWNEESKEFFINSNHPNLSEIVKKLNEADAECAKNVRGVMVFGKIKNLTEEQFLNIIDPKILSKEIKDAQNSVDSSNNIEETWTEEDEKELQEKTQELVALQESIMNKREELEKLKAQLKK